MMLTLEEAILHAEEVAEKNEEECKNWTYGASRINDDESRKKQYLKHAEMWQECAKEHRHLAGWLRELKAYRKARQELEDRHAVGTLDLIDSYIEEVNADEERE